MARPIMEPDRRERALGTTALPSCFFNLLLLLCFSHVYLWLLWLQYLERSHELAGSEDIQGSFVSHVKEEISGRSCCLQQTSAELAS